MKKQARKQKKHSANLHVIVFKEGKKYVAYSPTIDLATQGNSREDAGRMFDEAAGIFFEELVKMGTLEKELERLGWVKTVKEGWAPPVVVASELRSTQILYA